MKDKGSKIIFTPIGLVKTAETSIPRHWSVSQAMGEIVIKEEFSAGLRDIRPGERILVVFHFHKSPKFSSKYLIQQPPHKEREFGIFSTCSPIRPNPIGISIVEVLEVKDNHIRVKGIDMIDGTPVLDIKPWHECGISPIG